MIENRKLQRRHLIYYLRVYNRENNALLGHLVDITAEGIMVISETPIETNRDFNLRMELPSQIFGKTYLDFPAKSVWCRTDINNSFYDTGFSLSDVTHEDLSIIEQLIFSFGFRN